MYTIKGNLETQKRSVFLKNLFTLFARISSFILLHEKFLQFDWFRAVVFQLNLIYPYVKIRKPLRVVV